MKHRVGEEVPPVILPALCDDCRQRPAAKFIEPRAVDTEMLGPELESVRLRKPKLFFGSLVVSIGLLTSCAGQWRYYDGTLYLLALLHVGGAVKLYY